MRIILRVEIMDRKRVQNKKTDYFVKPLFIISLTLKKILYLCLPPISVISKNRYNKNLRDIVKICRYYIKKQLFSFTQDPP